jgi:hypothetical protein
MRRTHDDSADKVAVLAGLAPASNILGNGPRNLLSIAGSISTTRPDARHVVRALQRPAGVTRRSAFGARA